MPRNLPVIAVLVTLIVAGCATASGAPPADGAGQDPPADTGDDTGSEALDTLRVLARPEARGQKLIRRAALRGQLGGRVADNGTACLWVEAGGTRTVVVWPHGYAAADNPLRVLDAKGNTVATVGDQVSISGGATATGYTPEPELVAACGDTSRLFSAESIRRR